MRINSEKEEIAMNKLKVLGIAASVIGAGVSLVSDYVGKKELDAKVTEKVAEALAKAAEEKK